MKDSTVESIRVVDILPFWKYAVGPSNLNNAALPYYLRSTAERFFKETIKELPWCGCRLYRRCWGKEIEILEEYIPDVNNPSTNV